MASSLECLGLAGPDDDSAAPLLGLIEPLVRAVGRSDDVHLLRYDDPTGARVHLAYSEDAGVVELIPSYAGPPGAVLADVTSARGEIVTADVQDEGELATRLACDLVQWRYLPDGGGSGPAAITALGVDVTAHADRAAYDASLGDEVPWAAESFLPYGLFGAGDVDSDARLSGTVLSCETHHVELTGRSFHAARVRTFGFEAELVLASREHPTPPTPGSIVSGTVYLVAEMAHLVPRRRRWLRNRR
jgi:hypothetical protein